MYNLLVLQQITKFMIWMYNENLSDLSIKGLAIRGGKYNFITTSALPVGSMYF